MNNNTDSIQVSVKCAVYNHEPYLRKCLNGFIMQKTNFRFEVIVHDDASTDGSASIIREYAEKYPDIIKPIFETENLYSKNPDSIRRIMHNACSGKYNALCEGDDYWTDPLKLQKQYDALEAHPECSICTHTTKCVNRNGIDLKRTIPAIIHTRDILDIEYFLKRELPPPGWGAHTTSFFFKKEIVDRMINNPPSFVKEAKVGDLPLVLLAFEYGSMFFISDIMSCYRKFSGGFNSNLKKNTKSKVAYFENCIKYFCLYDVHTQYKHHTIIKKYLRMRKFDIQIKERHYIKALIKYPDWLFFKTIGRFKKFWLVRHLLYRVNS